MATYVLVHGAWHGGWCWSRVAQRLRASGHEVFTPTLSGLGERRHIAGPQIDLSTHVTDVANLLRWESLRDVVLVGHSYGGMVVTGAAAAAPDRVRHLVYLDAYAPEDGRSVTDYTPADVVARMRDLAETTGEGWRAPHLPLDVLGVVEPGDVEWVAPLLVDHPFRCFTTPVGGVPPDSLPRTYVYCTVRPMGFFDQFREKARASGWDLRDLETGHDAMVSAPSEVAEILESVG